MAAPIVRPRFSEGQVLAAADLEAQVTYARLDSAIHERTEHIGGIAAGLGLVLRDEQVGAGNKTYGQLWVEAGVGIDASGRRIVVPEDQRLTERDFVNAGVWSSSDDPATTRYPVFLVAIEEPVTAARSSGRCGVVEPNRTAESHQLEFGRPGAEQAVLRPTPIAAGAAPATGGKVLLGFVTWDNDVVAPRVGGFTGALRGPGAGVRYAGVRASSVIPHQGMLLLATGDSDPRFVLMLSQDDQGKAELRFGRQQGTNSPSPLFTVDDRGDVKVQGKINSQIPQLPVQMSGSLSHGLKLPLPPAITEEMVTAGRVTLQYLVSPHLAPQDMTFGGPPERAFPVAIECWVESDRRLHCRFRWERLSTPANALVTAGTADYLLTATPVG
jgi:hypothetical protein